ncbi:MAG: hypothetical protein IJA86_06330 [Clostridia bacterium]|nr:hypothetical protein [Clostridia bacterium]
MKVTNPEEKRRRRTTWMLLYLLFIMVPLLSASTYTWFSLSRTPKINTMSLYVNTPAGLQITWNPDDENSWGQHLDYADYAPSETLLKPITYSDEKQIFYGALFGGDGRITGLSYALSDEKNTNRSDSAGYYLKMTCYLRTDENVSVSLSRAHGNSGTYLIGTPVWNGEDILHNDGGNGAQSAVRVGFRITKYDAGGAQTGEPSFIIYEPNCDMHEDGSQEYVPTHSIDGSETLVPADRLIRQTKTAWAEMDPVQKDALIYDYGEFLDDPFLFNLDGNCMAKVEIYLWLEGQDFECTNEIGVDAQIFASIQFHSVLISDSGMEEIPRH